MVINTLVKMTSLKDEVQPFESRSEYMTFSHERHPFNKWSKYCNPVEKSQLLEVFFPREFFAINGSKFVHFTPDCTDTSRKVLDLLYLYCYVVERVRGEIFGDNEEKPQKPRRSDSRASNSNDEIADQAAQERNAEEDKAKKARDEEDKKRGMLSLMEVVPLASDETKVAGYRKKLIINTPRASPAQILSLLFTQNEREQRRANVLHNRFQRKDEKKARIHLISFTDYINLCQWYLGRPLPADDTRHPGLIVLANNSLNPLSVFSLHNSLQFARRHGANPRYTQFNRYIHNGCYCSPNDGKNMYWLLDEHDKMDRVLLYIWPNIRKPLDHDRQKEMYMSNALAVADLDDEEEEEQMRQRLSEVYDLTCRNVTSLNNIHTIRALQKRQKAKHEELQILLESTKDPHECAAQLVKGMDEITACGLDEFKQIFSATGTVPRALKAIAMYIERNFTKGAKMPWDKQLSNTSRFGELIASLTASSESLLRINTLQTDQVGCFLKVIHLYSDKKFHVHTLWTGAPRAGKSHIQKTLADLLIEGTFQEYAYASAKADAVAGDERDYTVTFYEEIPGSMLGANKAGAGGKAAATAMTDQESFIKNILTSGRFNAKRQEKDENGKHISTDVIVFCNTVMFAATNEPLTNIPDAMLSRYHLRNLQTTTRLDGGGLVGEYIRLVCCVVHKPWRTKSVSFLTRCFTPHTHSSPRNRTATGWSCALCGTTTSTRSSVWIPTMRYNHGQTCSLYHLLTVMLGEHTFDTHPQARPRRTPICIS